MGRYYKKANYIKNKQKLHKVQKKNYSFLPDKYNRIMKNWGVISKLLLNIDLAMAGATRI